MMKSRLALCLIVGVATGVSLAPDTAKAWVSFGFAVPPVVVAPAPAPYPYPYPYYPPPPPGYYPPAAYPQPGYAAPPAPPPPEYSQTQPPAYQPEQQDSQAQTRFGSMCYAGNYTCAAAPYSPAGSTCSCPGLGAPSFGTVQ